MAAPALVLDDFIPFRLSFTSNLVSDTIARAYETLFGLSIPEWRLIAVVAEAGSVTQSALGTRTRMDKVTVSRAAGALVDRGLVFREANPDDRRSHLLRLSADGRSLHAIVAPKALELERRIFQDFDPADIARFVAMLRRIEGVTLAMADQG